MATWSRYGQRDTAQVYNFVTTDTIEGNIFLLLDEKLHEIALTLGKVDENGEPAEDFRMQVLGQLNTRLNYERLYQEALADPSLKRTRQEIEVAMTNAERVTGRIKTSQLWAESIQPPRFRK